MLHSELSPKHCWLTAQPHIPPPPSLPPPQPPGSTSRRQPRRRPSLPCRAPWRCRLQRPAYLGPPSPSSPPSVTPSPASRPNSQQQLQLVTLMSCCMPLMLRWGGASSCTYRLTLGFEGFTGYNPRWLTITHEGGAHVRYSSLVRYS